MADLWQTCGGVRRGRSRTHELEDYLMDMDMDTSRPRPAPRERNRSGRYVTINMGAGWVQGSESGGLEQRIDGQTRKLIRSYTFRYGVSSLVEQSFWGGVRRGIVGLTVNRPVGSQRRHK